MEDFFIVKHEDAVAEWCQRANVDRLVDSKFFDKISKQTKFFVYRDKPTGFVAVDEARDSIYVSSITERATVEKARRSIAKCSNVELPSHLVDTAFDVSNCRIRKQQLATLHFSEDVFPAMTDTLLPIAAVSPQIAFPLISAFSTEVLGVQASPEALLATPSREFFVLLEHGTAVAVVALTRLVGAFRCVSYLYVPAAHRRSGCGDRAFAAIGALAASKHQKVFLNVRIDNEAAIRLYQKYTPICAGTMARISRG
jgi:hypothetical protein